MRFLGSFFGAALMQIDEQKPHRACKPDQEERDPGDLIAAAGVIDGTYERRGKVPASERPAGAGSIAAWSPSSRSFCCCATGRKSFLERIRSLDDLRNINWKAQHKRFLRILARKRTPSCGVLFEKIETYFC